MIRNKEKFGAEILETKEVIIETLAIKAISRYLPESFAIKDTDAPPRFL